MSASKLIVRGAIALLLAGAAAPALAHTPFVAPFAFSPERDYVGVQSGMSEEAAFVPDFAIRGTGDWIVVGPDGATTKATPTNLKSINVADIPLPTAGTYRIGTGERPGRQGKVARVDGVWRVVRPAPAAGAAAQPARPMERREEEPGRGPGPIDAADVPAGAETLDTQSFLIAETYVTRGAPTPGALKPSGKGFELEPITHPSEVFLDEGFTFRVLVDGQPASGVHFVTYRGGEGYDGGRTAIEVTTGADGKATVKFTKPGAYMLEAHYPAQAAPGAAPATKSWVYSLSFEVTE